MCNLCITTQNFDPCRHEPASRSFAEITESADALSLTATQYTIAVDDVFNGSIGFANDVDWVRVSLVAGETYEISQQGQDSSSGTLNDPYLEVYSGSGALLASNDDGGNGLESELTFTATISGDYYLSAAAFGTGTGTYQLSISESGSAAPGPAAVGSLDQLADYLTEGYWQDRGGSGQRSFNTSIDNIITVDIDALTAEGKQLARWAFEAWEMVIDVDFQEVSFGADINFDDNQSGAFAQSSSSGSRILNASVNVSQTDWVDRFGATIDSQAFSTYLHEIGHAIGLGHLGNYNGNAQYGRDETFANDSWQVSVQSYFSQTENTTTNASYANALTTMIADILAAQNLYGAAGAGSATDGNTVWGANTNLTGYLGDYFQEVTGGPNSSVYAGRAAAFTIYDAGGIDTFDLSTSSDNNRVDLRAEQFSDVGGLIGNVAIARGTTVENFVGGSGYDTIIGNDANNHLSARRGDDTVAGGLGDDTLEAGAGNDDISGNSGQDSIRGGDGEDLLRGGTGNDTIDGDAGDDQLRGQRDGDRLAGGTGNDNINGGGGNDTLFGEDGNDFLKGGSRVDILFGGNGNDLLLGNSFDDDLNGGAGNDILNAGGDNDTLNGGTGNDILKGGTGNDTFEFTPNYGQDTITDFSVEDDVLQLSVSLTGTRNIENVINGAQINGGDVVFDFGSTVITLEGLNSTDGLLEAIDIL